MSVSPDLSTFTSRLDLQAELAFESALRIGASRSVAVDESDLPVLRTAAGLPYIPGSSFKGALRSYIESVLRTLQAQPALDDLNLACLSVGKPQSRSDGTSEAALCLTQGEVSLLKSIAPTDWHQPNKIPKALKRRLPASDKIQTDVASYNEQAVLDRVLRDLSCWTCRVFGNSWLASKVLIRDLMLNEASFYQTEIRDGVGIDRDSGRAADGAKYQFEVVPSGAAFQLRLLVENATEAELGLLWLGLSAFEQGHILMGGAKSRGLGWCKLAFNWTDSQYVTTETLLNTLLPPMASKEGDGEASSELSTQPHRWIKAFLQAIGATSGVTGGNNA